MQSEYKETSTTSYQMSIRHYSHLQKFTFTFLMLLSATIVFNNVWIPDRLDSLQHRKQDRYNFHMAYSFFVDTKICGFVGDKEYINNECLELG